MANNPKEESSSSKIRNISEINTKTRQWDATHTDMVDKPLVINACVEGEGPFGPILIATCEVEGETKDILIGGSILMKQLNEVKDHLPLSATIRWKGQIYIFE